MPAGRKTKRTPQLEEELLQALRLGNNRSTSCAYVGLPISTFETWLRNFEQFRAAVELAEATAEVRVVGSLRRAIEHGSVRAQMFWLQTQRGWKITQQIDIEVTVRTLALQMGLDPDLALGEVQRILDVPVQDGGDRP